MNPVLQIEGLANASVLPPRALHLAIGIFDGVHRGHRAVIETAVTQARIDGGLAAVLTFWPHPGALLRPEQPTRLIMDVAAKMNALGELGVAAVITQAFSADYSRIEAEDFIPHLKKNLPQLKAIYVGENWRFGRDRRGDVALLTREAASYDVAVVSLSRREEGGEPVSSTRLRSLLEAGDVATVNTLLGRPYTSEGLVQPGKRLGRTIGFPTLNIPWSPELRPRYGVYAVRLSGEKSKGVALEAIANYGLRPTVENSNEPRLEIHLLTDCPFGEGDRLTIEWLWLVRAEKKFSGLAELRAQIEKDVTQVRADFSLR